MKPAALAQLVRAHEKPVKRFLRNRGASRSDSDDLAQELWIRVLRLGKEDNITKPQSYLFATAKNVLYAARQVSCNSKPHDCIDELPAELFIQDSIEHAVLDDDTCRAVRSALDRLPKRQREFIDMHIEGKTYKQIAEATGHTYRTVLRQLTHAYAALRNDPMLAELRS
ncbi:MAG TPA: sigma-70 family RNA polymerase sigma factor [Steroidobacter sp.]|uniref:RNA polymerase sigma factor n=1 Tax=Steroidobacter sp. TaxID=1978227 RepID=UPI002ED9712B